MEERKSKLQEENLNPRFGPLALPLDALLCCSAGVFIGAESRRVPDEVAHKICCLISPILPQICGFCRNSAAKMWLLATRFGAWPLLIRSSGRLLLEV